MLAYHNDPTVKTAILHQLEDHYRADEIVQGKAWENGKGCAVGCTLHAYDHSLYESRFGIPVMLAHLEDTIFEGLPNDKAKEWPLQFMSAITPGADLSRVGWQFLHWLLTDSTVNPGINHPLVKEAINTVAELMFKLTAGESIEIEAAESAESAAESAARSAARSAESAAESAARSAARSARSAAWSVRSAAWSVRSAAWSVRSAAWSVRSAAGSARSAAWSVRSAAWSVRSAAESAAWSAAGSASYIHMRDKLLELLKGAK